MNPTSYTVGIKTSKTNRHLMSLSLFQKSVALLLRQIPYILDKFMWWQLMFLSAFFSASKTNLMFWSKVIPPKESCINSWTSGGLSFIVNVFFKPAIVLFVAFIFTAKVPLPVNAFCFRFKPKRNKHNDNGYRNVNSVSMQVAQAYVWSTSLCK